MTEENNCPICASISDPDVCAIHTLLSPIGAGWDLYKHEQMLHGQTRAALENALKRVSQLEYCLTEIKKHDHHTARGR